MLLLACNSERETKVEESKSNEGTFPIESGKLRPTILEKGAHLDTATLISKMDSFMESKMGLETNTKIQTEILSSWEEYYTYPHTDSAVTNIKYRIRPHPHRSNGFNLYESIYLSTDDARKSFKESRKKADKRVVENHLPGFSKANDYLILVDSLIFSMNVPCTYSNMDVTNLKKIIRASIVNIELAASIYCKCGSICDLDKNTKLEH
jgi:hypothetical protein